MKTNFAPCPKCKLPVVLPGTVAGYAGEICKCHFFQSLDDWAKTQQVNPPINETYEEWDKRMGIIPT